MTNNPVRLYGWCGPAPAAEARKEPTSSSHSLRDDATGYFAMVAFLSAYLLNIAGAGRLIQAVLNLAGSLVAAAYLYKKRAVPSVISNLAWVAITIGGLMLH
jgi:hypothetical protein